MENRYPQVGNKLMIISGQKITFHLQGATNLSYNFPSEMFTEHTIFTVIEKPENINAIVCDLTDAVTKMGFRRALISGYDWQKFEVISSCTTKSDIYCNCSVPDKKHNIGAGTLDFYVCKKCKKEVKD